MLVYVWTLYRHVCACSQLHFISHQARSALRRRRVSAPRRSRSFWAAAFLAPVFSTDRPPRRGLPRPNCHSHGFTSYTWLPRWPSAAAESQLPTGKPDLLCRLYWWGIVGVELPARNKGISGTLPIILAAGATYRQGVGKGSYNFNQNMIKDIHNMCMNVQCTYLYVHCTNILQTCTYMLVNVHSVMTHVHTCVKHEYKRYVLWICNVHLPVLHCVPVQ